jgi:hypothetical protein
MDEAERKRSSRRQRTSRRPVPALPLELMGKILERLVDTKSNGTVLLLSMTCKGLRDLIGEDARLWHSMYSHWRGPVRHQMRRYGHNNSLLLTVATVPTTPRCLPNFRIRTPSVR